MTNGSANGNGNGRTSQGLGIGHESYLKGRTGRTYIAAGGDDMEVVGDPGEGERDEVDLSNSLLPSVARQVGVNAQGQQTITWRGFRVPSKDHHGHSERFWVTVQPGHARMLASALGAGIFPYRTMGDIIRHAIDRHLRFLEQLAPIPSITAQVDAIMEVLKEDEFQTDFHTMFDKLQQQVSIYVGLGENQEARALVARIRTFLSDMPDDDPWKERYENEMKERFGHLIDNARGVSLRQMLEDD